MIIMNIEVLKETNWLILDAVVGSNLYGLATATSDVDHKGIFVLPQKELGALNQITQVSDEKLAEFDEVLSHSKLPDDIDFNKINDLVLNLRALHNDCKRI